MGHAFFHNKIESYLLEIAREYSLQAEELNEEDERELKHQFQEKYLNAINVDSFPRYELVFDSSQRLGVLVKTVKRFMDDLFDSNTMLPREDNIHQKLHDLRSSYERLLAEHAVMKNHASGSLPGRRCISQQSNNPNYKWETNNNKTKKDMFFPKLNKSP